MHIEGIVDDHEHMVDDAHIELSMILWERLKSYYVCNMSQENIYPSEDHVVEKDPAKLSPKHRELVEYRRDLDTELGKPFATNLHMMKSTILYRRLKG